MACQVPGASKTSDPYTWPRVLDAGTYTTPFVWDIPFAVTFTVPAGWQSRDVEVTK